MGLFNKFKEIFKGKETNDNRETYDKGLEKSRTEFISSLSILGHKYTKVTDEYFDELENILIKADIGIKTVMDFTDKLKKRVKSENITSTEELKEVIVDELFMIYVKEDFLTDKINIQTDGPTVILMVGVNGVGKTTTIGKLANLFNKQNKKVLLVAADTFRAGAVEQLKEWADRTDSLFVGKKNADPASVIYDGLEKAKEENNKELMEELKKEYEYQKAVLNASENFFANYDAKEMKDKANYSSDEEEVKRAKWILKNKKEYQDKDYKFIPVGELIYKENYNISEKGAQFLKNN